MLAPVYGLDLRNSALVILFFTLLTTILPAFMCTLGPKTGMRQMVQARYSFGWERPSRERSRQQLANPLHKGVISSASPSCSTSRPSRASASSWPSLAGSVSRPWPTAR